MWLFETITERALLSRDGRREMKSQQIEGYSRDFEAPQSGLVASTTLHMR